MHLEIAFLSESRIFADSADTTEKILAPQAKILLCNL
jgi:hypothetical protein